jgi:hypothetical protein
MNCNIAETSEWGEISEDFQRFTSETNEHFGLLFSDEAHATEMAHVFENIVTDLQTHVAVKVMVDEAVDDELPAAHHETEATVDQSTDAAIYAQNGTEKETDATEAVIMSDTSPEAGASVENMGTLEKHLGATVVAAEHEVLTWLKEVGQEKVNT